MKPKEKAKMKKLVLGALCLVLGAGVAQAAPILLKSGTIDPQGQSGRPKARLMAAANASAAKGGLYIIQHEGAIPPGWRRQLKKAGARIRGYVPENAYIIEVSDEAYAKVEAVEHAYLGAYRAADRIEPTLRTEDDMICVISLFDAAARDTVRARLASVRARRRSVRTGRPSAHGSRPRRAARCRDGTRSSTSRPTSLRNFITTWRLETSS